MTKILLNEEIKPAILQQLKSAKKSIFIVVAWFNDKEIFDLLVNIAKEKNVLIKLILSEEYEGNTINTELNFQELLDANETVYIFKIPKDAVLVHSKFFIVDEINAITGSYNLTYGAYLHNRETVVLFENDLENCKKLVDELDDIYKIYCEPLIKSSISKFEDFFNKIKSNIEHGNLRMASDVDYIVKDINSRLFQIKEKIQENIETFEDFNYKISLETNDEILLKWWELLPNVWIMFFSKNILKFKYIEPNLKISSIRNLLTVISDLYLTDFKDIHENMLNGLKNINCINKLSCSFKQIYTISSFSSLENLTELLLTNNRISTLNGISEFKNLKILNVECNSINTIEDISENLKLKELNIKENPCSSLNGIEKLKGLELLYCDERFEKFPIEIDRLKSMGLNKMTKLQTNFNGTIKIYLKFEKEK